MTSRHQFASSSSSSSSAAAAAVAGSKVPQCNLYGGLRDDSAACSLHDPHGYCPSSWHAATDRHSPVFPNNQHHQQPSSSSSPQSGFGNSNASVYDHYHHQQQQQPQFGPQHQQQIYPSPSRHAPNWWRKSNSVNYRQQSDEGVGYYQPSSCTYDSYNGNQAGMPYNQLPNQMLHQQRTCAFQYPNTQMIFSNNNYFITCNIDSANSINFDHIPSYPTLPYEFPNAKPVVYSTNSGKCEQMSHCSSDADLQACCNPDSTNCSASRQMETYDGNSIRQMSPLVASADSMWMNGGLKSTVFSPIAKSIMPIRSSQYAALWFTITNPSAFTHMQWWYQHEVPWRN